MNGGRQLLLVTGMPTSWTCVRSRSDSEEKAMDDLINADFTQRIVLVTDDLPWTPSPQAGVERRLLDRVGGEVARATSLVRYAPHGVFPRHSHGLGEEFLVLDGVFSDEHGDYPAGTYVRNPPGSSHSPRTEPGCTILVKLRQMPGSESRRVVVDTGTARWGRTNVEGHRRQVLYASTETEEMVTLEKLAAGIALPSTGHEGGEEIFVLTGTLADDYGRYGAGTWIRNPPGSSSRLGSAEGAVFWAKRGHLRPGS
jgi:anti-sigma factor ChrR (cupin superfamily)